MAHGEAQRDRSDASIKPRTSTAYRIERLQGEARRIREFLATHAERRSGSSNSWRRAFIASMILALPWYLIYPLAPPRFTSTSACFS